MSDGEKYRPRTVFLQRAPVYLGISTAFLLPKNQITLALCVIVTSVLVFFISAYFLSKRRLRNRNLRRAKE